MILIRLLWEYLKIGCFAVGGGMATLPFLYDIADKTGWFTYEQIADMLAVSESTPGPIGINMATYVGYTVAGVPGVLIAALAVIMPGIILTMIVVSVLNKFRDNKYVNGIFYGIRPASVGLIFVAGLLVLQIVLFNTDATDLQNLLNYKAIVMGVILLILTRWVKPTKDLHPVIFIAASAVIGILIF